MNLEKKLEVMLTRLKYKNRNATIRDVVQSVTHFPDLHPDAASKMINGGQTDQKQISLEGTIPVKFKGQIYNIPICVWLLESYPDLPPIVSVKPTTAMVLKPGKHVDQMGRVSLPYLTDWTKEKSDLYSLIQILCLIFGDDPPLYSRVAPCQSLQKLQQVDDKTGSPGPSAEANPGEKSEANDLRSALLLLVEEKLREKLSTVFKEIKVELDGLQSNDDELKEKSKKLDKILEKLSQSEVSVFDLIST